jgi:hypothetical protein
MIGRLFYSASNVWILTYCSYPLSVRVVWRRVVAGGVLSSGNIRMDKQLCACSVLGVSAWSITNCSIAGACIECACLYQFPCLSLFPIHNHLAPFIEDMSSHDIYQHSNYLAVAWGKKPMYLPYNQSRRTPVFFTIEQKVNMRRKKQNIQQQGFPRGHPP